MKKNSIIRDEINQNNLILKELKANECVISFYEACFLVNQLCGLDTGPDPITREDKFNSELKSLFKK